MLFSWQVFTNEFHLEQLPSRPLPSFAPNFVHDKDAIANIAREGEIPNFFSKPQAVVEHRR
jgi:hypothetical protein